MWLLKILAVPLLLYLAFVGWLFFAQTALVFPTRHVGPAARLPASAERLELAGGPGVALHGVRIPPARPPSERLLILGFGGNASNAETTAALLHDLYPEAEVVTFHYRGYAPSGGAAGAAALKADALALHDEVRGRFRPERIVAVGFSIGTGIASALAAERPLDGLVLVSPFDSLAAVAAGHYPWVPVRLLFRHRLEPARDLAGTRVPVAIVSGSADSLVVPARTRALEQAVPNLAFARAIAGAGHNDIYDRPEFRAAMREALARVLSAQS